MAEGTLPERKCGRCRETIRNLGDATILKLESLGSNDNRSWFICEKCKCGVLEWFLSGDPIQQKCDKG